MEGPSLSFDSIGTSLISPLSNGPTSPSALPSSAIPLAPSPPLRESIPSASELPHRDIKAAVFSTHVASDRYVELHKKAMQSQRQAHDDERTLWEQERQELWFRIAELESTITRLHRGSRTDSQSVASQLGSFSLDTRLNSRSVPGSYISGGKARERSSSSGSARSSMSGTHGHATGVHPMQSIPEGSEERRRSVSFATNEQSNEQLNKALEGQAVPIELINNSLDGVMIKVTSLPKGVKEAILADSHSGTPSPLRSPSPMTRTPGDDAITPNHERPTIVEIPSTQTVLQLPPKELYTHAAGHTPLARLKDSDSASTSAGGATPTTGIIANVAEVERPPLEPHPSTLDGKPIRPPNERSDSYFNVPLSGTGSEEIPLAPKTTLEDPKPSGSVVVTTGIESLMDEDPALNGPLTMPSDPQGENARSGSSPGGGNKGFLNQLDSKLNDISKRQSESAKSGFADDDGKSDKNDTDPPLRIRRSMNFGAPLGFRGN